MSVILKSASIGPNIIYDGLVLYLDANNSKSYPGSGNIWYDLSGKNNNCYWNNLPTYNNSYFTFNGTSNYGTITNNETLDFSSEKTLIIWMKHSYTVGRRNPWDQAYGGYGTWTHEQGNNISAYFGDSGLNGTPYIGRSSSSTPINIWNCMATTRNTTQHSWYFNGNISSTVSHSFGTLTTTSANIRIGNGYAGYWEGDMSIVMAYDRTLSQNEIKQNFISMKSKFSL